MFTIGERVILAIVMDPIRIFYIFLVAIFMWFSWRSDRPGMPIIIVIRRRTNRQFTVQRTPSQESEIQVDTEVEDLNVETPDTTGEEVQNEESNTNSTNNEEEQEILRRMDSDSDNRAEVRNRKIGNLGNSCDRSNFPDKFEDLTDIQDNTFSPDSIKIKLKYLNDEIKIVRAKPSDSVADFKKQYFSTELASDKLVKLIFYGQVLSDDKTISNYGIVNETVVHCLILKNRQNPTNGSSSAGTVRNSANNLEQIVSSHLLLDHQILLIYIGMIFVTLTLLFCWYCRIQYSYLFSPYSTIGLGLMTSLFFTMIHLLSLIER